jgi:hypothetical protein
MLGIFEKLTTRRSERQQQNAASWSQFVVDVTDARMKDADEILTGLERLQKSPEQLVQACELLTRRRAWAAELAAGEKAEAAYPEFQAQLERSEKELEALIEQHQKKQMPLRDKIERSRTSISSGSDAQRRLLDTCGSAYRQTVFGPIETELIQVEKDLAAISEAVQLRRRWLVTVQERGDSAAAADQKNLPVMQQGYRKMLSDEATTKRRLEEIQSRFNAEFQKLLRPEAI